MMEEEYSVCLKFDPDDFKKKKKKKVDPTLDVGVQGVKPKFSKERQKTLKKRVMSCGEYGFTNDYELDMVKEYLHDNGKFELIRVSRNY